VITNAAGAVNPNYGVGDLVVIRDHLNWMPGPWPSLAGPGQPLPSVVRRHDRLYDPGLAAAAIEAGLDHGFAVREGTYLATLGPTYETRAEYRMMRILGADLVGMSTVPEVLVAGALGLRVLAISMVSNVANPDRPGTVNHDEVLRAGRAAADKMEAVVRAAIDVSERDRDAGIR
jgi:purine-nucleoside phosphorylase